MSVVVDRQFVEQLGYRLENFSWVKPGLANCRCEICGDSQKDLTKRRGYFIDIQTGFNYFCHKCGEDSSMSLRTYLDRYHPDLHRDYVRESYLENGGGKGRERPKKVVHKAPQSKTKSLGNRQVKTDTHPVLDKMMRVDELSDDHPCRRYVLSRAIPVDKHKLLYYASNFSEQCLALNDDDPDLRLPDDARLVIPMFDSRGQLKALQGRALDPKAEVRYITVKKNAHITKTYGDERVDPKRVNLVVEGPIDSLFLPNCRATCDADLMTITGDNTIYVPDNQYREVAICKRIEKWISVGAKVVLFPPSLHWKDINDMRHPNKGNMSERELLKLLSENVYSGLSAKLRFAKLRKC